MARINIEDSLWSDPRFMRLCIKMGDEFKAIGAVVSAWRQAQKHYCPDKKPIPQKDFEAAGLPIELVDVGLAVKCEDGFKMKGSDEHFAWWFQRWEAGKKGGRPSKTENRPVSETKRKVSDRNRVKPSISNSISSSTSNSESISDSDSSKGQTLPRLAMLWNEHSAQCLKNVDRMSSSSKRRKACEARWRENPDESYWIAVIERINALPGCQGHNDRGWFADIDFLTRTDTAEKVLEGKYDNWGKTNRQSFAEMKSAKNADLVRRARMGEFDEYEN